MPERISLARKEKKVGAMSKAYIIHGWAYSTTKYEKINRILKNKGLKTTILNVPGLTAKIDGVWKLGDYVNWLKKIVDKDKRKVVLIGHSNGGRIAVAFASRYPHNLAYLILIDSAGIYHDELHTKIRLMFFATLAKIGKRISSSKILRNVLYKFARENNYNHATAEMKKTMVNLIKEDLSLYLQKIITPTLIIWGEKDKVTPLSDAEIMHKIIKNSKLHIVKGARHSPHFTHTEEVANIIIQQLNNLTI